MTISDRITLAPGVQAKSQRRKASAGIILVLGLVRFRAIGFGGMGHHVTAKRRVEFDKFYKNPKALVAAPANLRLYLALGADAVGALLFVALFGLVRRADDP